MMGDHDPQYQRKVATGENGIDCPIQYSYKRTPIVITSEQIENPSHYHKQNTTATGVQIWGW